MKDIRLVCENFLNEYFGRDGTVPKKGEVGLRLVSLGNPEKTVQGELLSFFNSSNNKGYRMVSECGIFNRDLRRSLDLTVFDQNWRAICVIEIKHYSRNQGSLKALINGLALDRTRHVKIFGKKIPLIQIGLYTEVVDISIPFENDEERRKFANGFYRFVKTYYDRTRNIKCIVPLLKQGKYLFVSPNIVSFIIENRRISGRVHYCIK